MGQGGDPDGRQAAGPLVQPVVDGASERILAVLMKYVSAPMARAVLARAAPLKGPGGRAPHPDDLTALFATVEKSASLLVDRKDSSLLRGELQFELGRLMAEAGNRKTSNALRTESIDVRAGKAGEWDLSVVRARAREFVILLRGSSFDVMKAMTIGSELARNIMLYTPGGRVEFVPSDYPRNLRVRAIDEGPGIANVELVLSGRYRSKTGLGRGLIGVKQLCHRFNIETDAHGTRVDTELRF